MRSSTSEPTEEALSNTHGWYLELLSGEQVVTSAVTVYGIVTFSTHQPPSGAATCSNSLGTARVYNIGYLDASPDDGAPARSAEINGGGLPPSPVAGTVEVVVTTSTGEPVRDDETGEIVVQTVPFIIGAVPTSPLEGRMPVVPGVTARPNSVVYWHLQQ
jgi:type IV pilus assembly protein PilY1